MALRYIALRQNSTQRETSQEVTLDEIRVRVRAIYNGRQDRWLLDLLDIDDVPILAGLRLVPGVDLLAWYRHEARLPPGQLFVQSGSERQPPTQESLDVTVLLKYREAS